MNLLLGWNPWSVFEYLMTEEKVSETCWKFRRGYYKSEDPDWLSAPFTPYTDQHVDKVYVPSSLQSEDYEFIKSLGDPEVFYLEEGEYDYAKYKADDTHLHVPFYTMNPDQIANASVFLEVRKFVCSSDIVNMFLQLYDVVLPEDEYDVILYTDPLELDFGITGVKDVVTDYMRRYHGSDRILVKTHPRDTTVWDWDVCSPKIPAQLLLNRDAVHVFMYQTTVLRYLDKSKHKEMINIITEG